MPPTFIPDIQRILLENITQSFEKYIYGTITLYGSNIPIRIQLTNQSSKSMSKTPHLPQFTKRDSVCSTSVSLAVTNDIAILLSFPPPTKMFQFSGFPILHGSAHKNMLGSPIRQSWVPKMYAPRPSLSQLTTTFIGNSSQAIPQIAQVAKF